MRLKSFYTACIAAVIEERLVACQPTQPVEASPAYQQMINFAHMTYYGEDATVENYQDRVSQQGYLLSSVECWYEYTISGLRLTFTNSANGQTIQQVYGIIGSSPYSNTAIFSTNVVKIQANYYYNPGCLKFIEQNGTEHPLGPYCYYSFPSSYDIVFCGNMIGLTCSFCTWGWECSWPAQLYACTGWDDQSQYLTAATYQFKSVLINKTIIAEWDPSYNLPENIYFWTNANSCYSETFSAQFEINGQSVSTPSFLGFSGSWFIQITQLPSRTQKGIYTITVTAAVSGVGTVQQSFTLTVVDPCESTSFIDTLQDMAIKVGQRASSQRINLDYSLKQTTNNSQVCGSTTYSINQNYSFLNLSNTGSLTLRSSNPTDAIQSPYQVTIINSFDEYPTIKFEKTINLTITCEVSNLQIATKPNYKYTIINGIDQFPTIEVVTTQSPACNHQVAFTLTPFSIYQSVTTTEINKAVISFQNVPLTLSGKFPLTLSASVVADTSSYNFEVLVVDPCKVTSFQTSNPLKSMLVTIPIDNKVTQNFNVSTTAHEQNNNIVCPIKATLTNSANYISVSPDSSSIIIDSAQIAIEDLGVHSFTLKVESTIPSNSVNPAYYSFDVTLTCKIINLVLSQSVAVSHNSHPSGTYAPTTYQVLSISPQNACGQMASLQTTTTTKPSFVTFSGDNLVVDSELYQDVKIYSFTATFSIPDTPNKVIGLTGSVKISLNVFWDLCDHATVIKSALSFTTLTGLISMPDTVQSFAPFSDSGAQKYSGEIDVCQIKVYTIEPNYPFINIVEPLGNKFVDDWTIKIYSTDKKVAGFYPVKLICKLGNFPQSTSATHEFTVEMVDTCLTTQINKAALSAMATIVKDPPLYQSFPQLTDTAAQAAGIEDLCGPRLYSIANPKPFITFTIPSDPWHSPFVLQLQTRDAKMAGDYIITIKTTLKDYPNIKLAESSFPVKIKPNKLPYFTQKIQDTLFIQMTQSSETWTLKLPSFTDDDGDNVTLTWDFGGANFVQMREGLIQIEDISASLSSTTIPGVYYLKYYLSDGKDQVTFSQLLLVNAAPTLKQPEQQKKETEASSQVCTASISVPSHDSKVEYTSGTAAITLTWGQFELKGPECIKDMTVIVKIKTDWADTRIKMASDWVTYTDASIANTNSQPSVQIRTKTFYDSPIMTTLIVEASIEGRKDINGRFSTEVTILPQERKQIQTAKLSPPPVMSIESVSSSGLLILAFSEPLIIYDQPSDDFMLAPMQFLEIEVIKNPKSSYQDLPEYLDSGRVISVSVQKFSARQIEIQLVFSNPMYISYDVMNKDRLRVVITDPQTFVSAVDFVTTAKELSFDTIEMQKQISQQMAATATSIEKKQKFMVNTLSTSSLAINILLGLSLKYLWGMVNVLQFCIYMLDWHLNWPANASLAIKTLRTFALGEFIDYRKIYNKVLAYYGYRPKAKPARQLESAISKESSRILLTSIIGSIALLVVIVAAVVIYRFFTPVKVFVLKHLTNLKKQILWNGFIRFYLQSFLKFSISTGAFFFGLTDITIRRKTTILGVIVYIVFSAVIFGLVPFLFYRTLHRHKNQLFLTENKQKFGSLYLGIKIREITTVLNVFNFLALRLVFVILTFAMASMPGILVNMYMLVNNFNIIYVGWYQPFDTRAQNRIELANSYLLQVFAYNLLLLANLLPNPEAEYKLGWSIIAVIGLIFAVNMGYMMSLSIRAFFRKAYLYYSKRKEQQRLLREQIEINQALQAVQPAQPGSVIEISELRAEVQLQKRPILLRHPEEGISKFREVKSQLEQISSLNESQISRPQPGSSDSISLDPEQYVLDGNTRKPTPIQTAQLSPRRSPPLLTRPKATNLISSVYSLQESKGDQADKSREIQRNVKVDESLYGNPVPRAGVVIVPEESRDSIFYPSYGEEAKIAVEESHDSVFVSSCHQSINANDDSPAELLGKGPLARHRPTAQPKVIDMHTQTGRDHFFQLLREASKPNRNNYDDLKARLRDI